MFVQGTNQVQNCCTKNQSEARFLFGNFKFDKIGKEVTTWPPKDIEIYSRERDYFGRILSRQYCKIV